MASTTHNPFRTTLLSLPAELRNQIWGLVVRREKPVHLRPPSPVSGQANNKTAKLDALDGRLLAAFRHSVNPTTRAASGPARSSSSSTPPSSSNAVFRVNLQCFVEAFAVFCSVNKFLATDPHCAQSCLRIIYNPNIPRSVHPKLGPVTFWIDGATRARDWVELTHYLKRTQQWGMSTASQLRLFFRTPNVDVATRNWERTYCTEPTRFVVASTRDPPGRIDVFGKLGRITEADRSYSRVPGLSVLQLASCLFETEIGFCETLAHVPF
ncbi:uncharacterized protein PG986_014709 [Apiospora aurea]|uniref:Uncharacterized protein n=1 Tax=Apiospora aurea TaxID=335848 RepID=A0ABR1PTR9_9PEZI